MENIEPDGSPDRRCRFRYIIALKHIRLIREEPWRLQFALRHIDKRLPEYRAGENTWRPLIAAGGDAVATELLDRSPAGTKHAKPSCRSAASTG